MAYSEGLFAANLDFFKVNKYHPFISDAAFERAGQNLPHVGAGGFGHWGGRLATS